MATTITRRRRGPSVTVNLRVVIGNVSYNSYTRLSSHSVINNVHRDRRMAHHKVMTVRSGSSGSYSQPPSYAVINNVSTLMTVTNVLVF